MAETKGFEPSRRFPAYSLSRGAPSTTRPRLRWPVYPCLSSRYKAIFYVWKIFLNTDDQTHKKERWGYRKQGCETPEMLKNMQNLANSTCSGAYLSSFKALITIQI